MPRLLLPSDWDSLPDEELLNVRMCDLPIRIENELAELTDQLRQELKNHVRKEIGALAVPDEMAGVVRQGTPPSTEAYDACMSPAT